MQRALDVDDVHKYLLIPVFYYEMNCSLLPEEQWLYNKPPIKIEHENWKEL